MRWQVIPSLALVACGGSEVHPNDLTLAVEGVDAPIAVGARQELFVRDGCMAPEAACTSGLCCTTQTLRRIASADATPPILTTEIDAPTVSLVPASPGDTIVRITAELDDATVEATRNVRVRSADRVVLDAPLSVRPYGDARIAACLPPALMEVGSAGYIPFRAYSGTEALITTGWRPVTLDGDAIVLGEIGGEALRGFVTFDAVRVGMATVSSQVGAPSEVKVEVYDPAAIDGLRIAAPADLVLQRREVGDVDLYVSIGQRDVCSDTVQRVLIVETPNTCHIDAAQLWPNTDGTPSRVTMPAGVLRVAVRATAEGTCTLRAGVVGTNLGATESISVRRP